MMSQLGTWFWPGMTFQEVTVTVKSGLPGGWEIAISPASRRPWGRDCCSPLFPLRPLEKVKSRLASAASGLQECLKLS